MASRHQTPANNHIVAVAGTAAAFVALAAAVAAASAVGTVVAVADIVVAVVAVVAVVVVVAAVRFWIPRKQFRLLQLQLYKRVYHLYHRSYLFECVLLHLLDYLYT